MKKFLLLAALYFGLLSSISFAQQSKIDSLLVLLKTDHSDTIKLDHLNELALRHSNIGSYDSALFYGNSTLKLSNQMLKETIHPDLIMAIQKRQAESYHCIGNAHFFKGNYNEALIQFSLFLKISELIDYKIGVADGNISIGNVKRIMGNYPEALKNYFAGLKIMEEIGNKKGIAGAYNNIGVVYEIQTNYDEALKNYFSSLKTSRLSDNKKAIAMSYSNIGNVYLAQGNYQEALKNHFASLEIKQALGNKMGIAASYNNIGSVYIVQGNYQEALKNYFSSLKIKESIGDKNGVATSFGNIGSVYTKQKKYEEAEKFLFKAKELSNEIGNKEILKSVYKVLTELDSTRGNYKGAYENHKLYILYSDSLDNEETRKKTIQTQMTYDFEKKEAVSTAEHKKELENQEALAEEKSRKQKAVIGFVGFGLLLVLVFAGFIFRSLRVTRKQKVLIEEQKEIVEHQKHIVEEHQKEIVDSITYAKRIQYTLLANKKLLDDNLSSPWGGAEGGGGYFVLFKPKDIVSGDFYWATKKTDSRQSTEGKEEKTERFYIAACDSTGHGVPGAFMSLLNISFLNEAVNEKNILEPHEILNHVRKRLIENMDGGQDGMDCILLCIESSPLSFGEGAGVRCTYAAANNSPTIIKNGKLISLEADKMPVGKGEKGTSFTLRQIEIENGDELYLYTDGYADQFGGPKGKKFKYKQLDELLVSISSLTVTEQSEVLNQRFQEWKGNLEQVDDVLIIGVKL